MHHKLEVENVKCGGCVRTITDGVEALAGVANVTVDVEGGTVEFDAEPDRVDAARSKLASLGYPAPGTTEGLNAMGAKARSFASCAVGRLHDKLDA